MFFESMLLETLNPANNKQMKTYICNFNYMYIHSGRNNVDWQQCVIVERFPLFISVSYSVCIIFSHMFLWSLSCISRAVPSLRENGNDMFWWCIYLFCSSLLMSYFPSMRKYIDTWSCCLFSGSEWFPDCDPEWWPDLLCITIHPGIPRLSRCESQNTNKIVSSLLCLRPVGRRRHYVFGLSVRLSVRTSVRESR